ncbi:MAG TPA: SIR2 family protein [Bryobacteraceae bacterium]|nr:SIR2 family protein [Bryobacteraceae bacterium]
MSLNRSDESEAFLGALFPDYGRAPDSVEAKRRQARLIGEIQKEYALEGIALFLGAGVSQSLGLPGWRELIDLLTARMLSHRAELAALAICERLTEEERWKLRGTIEIQSARSKDRGWPVLVMARAIKDEMADSLAAQIARALYHPVRRILNAHHETAGLERACSANGHPPIRRPELPSSELLDALVYLARDDGSALRKGVEAIVNYNFDDLVDRKLQEQGVRCKTSLCGADAPSRGELPCFHVHGLIRSTDFVSHGTAVAACGNFVFSEDEYHLEYSDAHKWSNLTQLNMLQRYTGVFVGLSMEDPNLRRLIDVTHAQFPNKVHYAFLRRKHLVAGPNASVVGRLWEEIATKSFERIGVKIVWVDDHNELPALIRQIRDLRLRSASH